MFADTSEFENIPNQEGLLHTEVIYTSGQIAESLKTLLENREITPTQFGQLEKAVTISERIYTLNPRRDGFRNHAIGHVFPNIGNIIRNRGKIIGIVKDEVAQLKFNPGDMGATQEQRSLYASILLMLGHDWYEDYMGNDSREVFKEEVIKDFGEDIHNIIEILTKPDKGEYSDYDRDRVYYENLTSSNSRLVAIIKLLDRNSNHNDDFGVHDFSKVDNYCADTEQNLINWLRKVVTGPGEIFVDELVETVGSLRDDVADSGALSDATTEIVDRFLSNKRSDGTSWSEHVDRMIKMIKSLGLRKTLGFTLAIKMHDLFDLDGDMVVIDPEIKQELNELLKISQEKTAYSIGIAMGAKRLEGIMTTYLRDVDSSYFMQDGQVRDKLRQLYSPESKVPMTFDQLGEMVNYEPIIATEVMQEMSEWDIESLLVLVLERLDNLENPVMYQQPIAGKRVMMKDALYQWKTAQELLFLHPLLEIGGFRELANIVRGKAYEFLLQDNELGKKAKEEHRIHTNFFGKYKKMILLDMLEVEQEKRFVFRHREKEEGSTAKKMVDLERQGKPTEVGDFLSIRYVYDDESFPYTVSNVIELANHLTSEIEASFRNLPGRFPKELEKIKVEIENPRSDRKARGIYISTANAELIEEGKRLIESLKVSSGVSIVDTMEVVDIEDDGKEENANENGSDTNLPGIIYGKVDLNRIVFDEKVTPDDFESTQFYIKISGVPGYTMPIYIEVQLVSKESYKRGVVGPAAHHIYKLNQGFEKDENDQSKEEEETKLISISAFDQEVLLRLYKRFAAYRSSYRAHLFLTPRGSDQLKYLFGDMLDIFKDALPKLDFENFGHQNGFNEEDTHALVNHILPYIA